MDLRIMCLHSMTFPSQSLKETENDTYENPSVRIPHKLMLYVNMAYNREPSSYHSHRRLEMRSHQFASHSQYSW